LFLKELVKRSPAFERDNKKEFQREAKDAMDNLRRLLS